MLLEVLLLLPCWRAGSIAEVLPAGDCQTRRPRGQDGEAAQAHRGKDGVAVTVDEVEVRNAGETVEMECDRGCRKCVVIYQLRLELQGVSVGFQ